MKENTLNKTFFQSLFTVKMILNVKSINGLSKLKDISLIKQIYNLNNCLQFQLTFKQNISIYLFSSKKGKTNNK